MYLPNYKGGSIVNLMSSIETALGGKPKYKSLNIYGPQQLSKSKNVVLLVIDGLGYEYLMKYGEGTIFNKHLKGKMTSVFPSTTSAAMTVFNTGVPPQQHGMTGWFEYLKELGLVAIAIRYMPRTEKSSLQDVIDIKDIFNLKPFVNRLKAKTYIILDKKITKSPYSSAVKGKAEIVSYKSMEDCFNKLRRVIKKKSRKRKYIFVQRMMHDHYAHKYGVKSKKVYNNFKKLDRQIKKLVKSLQGTNTKIIITADHGLIDTKKSKRIIVNNHPKFYETLSMPLSGDKRVAYCYVKPLKVKQFKKYVKKNFRKSCYMYKSKSLLKRNFFGLFKPHKRLHERIGDYVLIMKENYSICDNLINEKPSSHIGDHGSVSKKEMLVPLVVIDC